MWSKWERTRAVRGPAGEELCFCGSMEAGLEREVPGSYCRCRSPRAVGESGEGMAT